MGFSQSCNRDTHLPVLFCNGIETDWMNSPGEVCFLLCTLVRDLHVRASDAIKHLGARTIDVGLDASQV
jgi:hypothetical protein